MGLDPEKVKLNGKICLIILKGYLKEDFLGWAKFNRNLLGEHELCATGTTGKILSKELGLDVFKFQSGPLEPQPHDVDVKALLRIAVVYNIPIACNRSTADFLVSSPLMREEYERVLIDWSRRLKESRD